MAVIVQPHIQKVCNTLHTHKQRPLPEHVGKKRICVILHMGARACTDVQATCTGHLYGKLIRPSQLIQEHVMLLNLQLHAGPWSSHVCHWWSNMNVAAVLKGG